MCFIVRELEKEEEIESTTFDPATSTIPRNSTTTGTADTGNLTTLYYYYYY